MARVRPAQVNIRSERARQRLDELVRQTGATATAIVEQALQNYIPPRPLPEDVPPGMKRVGRILVALGGPHITVESVQASIDEQRKGIRD
ncbi:MAG: hypothetical protein JO290_10325 [Sphingomonadaceae bacterium]|nr:hypothetical protein [Sphingomonadaceae bacterium]